MIRAPKILRVRWSCEFLRRWASQKSTTVELPLPPPPTRVEALPNFVRVATEYRKNPLVCMSLATGAGSRYEAACNNGIFNLIEHLAFLGFKSVSQEAMEKNLQECGAVLSVTTRREMQTFTAIGCAKSHERIFDYLAKVITEVQTNQINKALAAICSQAYDIEQDPKKLVFDYLHQCAFQGTTLAQQVMGPTCNYRLFKEPFLKEFMKCHFQPWRIVVASCGGVDHEKMMIMANAYFGGLKPTQCQYSFPDKRYTGSSVLFRNDDLPAAHVAIAVEAPGFCDLDYWTMLVAKNVVGAWDRSQQFGCNLANPLARAISSSKGCHMYEAFYIPYKDVGLWGVYFVADKMAIEDTVYQIQDQWMKMCTMLSDSEAQVGVRRTMVEIGRRYDGVVNSCKDIGKQVLYTGQRLEYAHAAGKVVCMRGWAVREVMMDVIFDKCPVVAAVGPTENLPDYNRIRAGMYWLRL